MSSSTETVERLSLLRVAADRFEGPAGTRPGNVFGGLTVARAAMAAGGTVPAGWRLHSLHCYFLASSDGRVPTSFTVDRLHDTDVGALRHVSAWQGERQILAADLALRAEPALGGPDRMTPPPFADSIGLSDLEPDEGGAYDWISHLSSIVPFEFRFPGRPPQFHSAQGWSVPPRQAVWVRPTSELSADPWQHIGALLYLSDCFLLATALLPHGLILSQVRFASLDHAVWIHAPIAADDWLYYDMSCDWTGNVRGLSTGRVCERDGTVLATVRQEGLVQPPSPRWPRRRL